MSPKICIIIQARMNSTRLPGKVLKPILGKPILWHLIERVKDARLVNEVIIATTNSKKDHKIYRFCLENSIKCFRGSENDVLERYYLAAKKNNCQTIVRLTADCPLIEPAIIDQTIKLYKNGNYDYVAVATGAGVAKEKINKFPDGLDCEVFSFKALEEAFINAKDTAEREHATMYIWKRPEKFRIGKLTSSQDFSQFRFVVDHKEDLKFVRRIYENLYSKNRSFSLTEIIKLLKKNPQFLDINRRHLGKEGYEDLWVNASGVKKLKTEFKNYHITAALYKKISGIVILSAEELDIKGENGERIMIGIKLAKDIKKAILIFLGTKRHNNYFENYLKLIHLKNDFLIPTNRINASTKTQLMDLAKLSQKESLDNLLIVSHAYHIPRIMRYCKEYLPSVTVFFQGVGNFKNQQDKIIEEIAKIKTYAKKGDLKLSV